MNEPSKVFKSSEQSTFPGGADRLAPSHANPQITFSSPTKTAIRNDPKFEAFVKSLETAPTSGLGKDAEYALFINSYNALAIKMVVDHPCRKSMFGLKMSPIASIKGERGPGHTSRRFNHAWR